MSDITLYASPKNDNVSRPVMLNLSTPMLIDLVTISAVTLRYYVDPESGGYAPPMDYVGQSFENAALELTYWSRQSRAMSGQQLYSSIWASQSLLIEYANWRNTLAEKDSFVVGEEYHMFAIVYHVMVMAHNWRVRCIEDTHRQHGPDFGTATGWQTFDSVSCVLDWPQRYGFAPATEILTLPSQRPHAYRLSAESAKYLDKFKG